VAYAKLGEIFTMGEQTERGIMNYEKALAANPALTEVYVPLGLAYLKVGNISKADEFSVKADGAGSSGADAQYLHAMVLYKQNKNAEALAAFQKTLTIDPNYSAARYYEAATYDRLNQSDQSIASYKRTVQTDPEFAPAWFDLGVAYYNAADYNNAANAYQQSIKYDPSNAEAHANLASTYRQQEKYAEANAEYKQAEALGMKTDPNLYNEWGYCLGKTNEWDKSAARLMTARELGQSAVDNSNVGWAYYNAGSQAKAKNDDAAAKANYELSKAFLQKAVEQDAKLEAAYLNLGSTYNGLGEFQLAVSVLNIAVGLRPNWVLALNQLGVGYRGAGDLASAISQFQRATTLDGNNIFGLFNLGEAYNASGNKKEAKKIQDRLRRIDPSVASRLDAVFNGKAVVDETKRKIENKIKIPRIPY
jgi:superkiller protein 3